MTARKSKAVAPFGWYWERVVIDTGKVLECGFVRKETQPLFEVAPPKGQEYQWTPLFRNQ